MDRLPRIVRACVAVAVILAAAEAGSSSPAMAGVGEIFPSASTPMMYQVCNRTDLTLGLAQAYKHDSPDVPYVFGWFTLQPGQCDRFFPSGSLDHFLFAYRNDDDGRSRYLERIDPENDGLYLCTNYGTPFVFRGDEIGSCDKASQDFFQSFPDRDFSITGDMMEYR